jgi:hypothetical protein
MLLLLYYLLLSPILTAVLPTHLERSTFFNVFLFHVLFPVAHFHIHTFTKTGTESKTIYTVKTLCNSSSTVHSFSPTQLHLTPHTNRVPDLIPLTKIIHPDFFFAVTVSIQYVK